MLKTIAVLPLLIAAPAAWAEATPEGASDLTAVFQTYLGAVPGVVTVTPQGESYLLKLDAAPLIAQIPNEANIALTVSPWEMTLTDNGDGTWGVTQDQPLSFAMSVPDETDMTISLGALYCEGIFDTALMAMSENACEATDLTTTQRFVDDPAFGPTDDAYAARSLSLKSAAAVGVRGGVDVTTAYTITGLEFRTQIPSEPGMAPVTIRATNSNSTYESKVTGYRPDAFLKLIAWLVAHPDEDATMAERAGLKTILSDGLPFFEELVWQGTNGEMLIETPLGPFTLAPIDDRLQLRGAVQDGLIRYAIRFSGLTPPPGVLPPFAESLIPESLSIDFAVNGYDVAAATQQLLGLLDLPDGATPVPEFGGVFQAALLPKGTVDIVLAPGEIGNAMFSLRYEGTMTAGPGLMPVGSGRVTAEGFDDVIAVLDGAPQEVKNDILPAMGAARGLARPGPDGQLVWEFDLSTPGTFSINGMDLEFDATANFTPTYE